jgi:acetyl-CoA carboxylase biotin carboxyl carrier protein
MNLSHMAAASSATSADPQEARTDSSTEKRDPNLTELTSPMVGTFYRAPSPESPPYVTEGDRVSKDAVLCIVEAMKVMNEIKAEHSGEIVEILVENGEAVEFGQPLILIRTAH